MKVIDVLSEACALLCLNDEQSILEKAITNQATSSGTGETEITTPVFSEESLMENEYIKKLFFLLKFSLREFCTNYFELISKNEITSEAGKINIANLPNFIKLQEVTQNGKMIKVKIVGNEIILPADGKYCLSYYTYPQISSVFDDISNFGIFNHDVVVYGLCAYFCLAFGRFDEFNNFHQQYVERAEELKTLKSFHLPLRRWE